MSMNSLHRALTLSLGLALTGAALPGLAQETTPPAATTTPATDPAAPAVEAPAADAATADGLSMGAEAKPPAEPVTQANAEVGQTYTVANFDAWEQRCVKMADGSDPCQMYQLLKDKDGNNVAEFSMFPLPTGQKAAAGATIIVPLETLLTANLVLAIDTGKQKIYPYNFCSMPGCVSRVGFTADEVAQFKKGAKASITIVPAADPTQKVVLDVSLKGFTAAMDAVAATQPKAP
ncbi:MAG: invasion associated locus B family protein [Cypionkella sp.]